MKKGRSERGGGEDEFERDTCIPQAPSSSIQLLYSLGRRRPEPWLGVGVPVWWCDDESESESSHFLFQTADVSLKIPYNFQYLQAREEERG